jgi:hypothetical protein
MNILNFPYSKTITDGERSEAKRLQAEFDRLDGHRNSLMPFARTAKYRAARDAYLADPSDENFEVVKRASFEKRFFKEVKDPIRFAAAARRNFILGRVVPWAIPILQRALEKAREQLHRVTKEEAARHLELTGEPMAVNGIVEAAKRPVRHLEAMLEDADKNGNSFRVYAVAGIFGEVGPLTGEVSPDNKAMATRSRPGAPRLVEVEAAESDSEDDEAEENAIADDEQEPALSEN